jgi:hypothetical protein
VNSEYERLLDSLPKAIEPFHPFRAPNKSIPLYSGQLRGNSAEGEFSIDGDVELAWQPTPQLRYRSVADVPDKLSFDLFDLAMRDIDLEWSPADLNVVPVPPEPSPNDDRKAPVSGRLTRLEIGTGQVLSFVTFQLPNFFDYVGDSIRHGNGVNRGRLLLSGAGWRVTIDNRPGLNEIAAELDRTGGYAITHAGRLEREDGQPFSRGQAREMLRALYWFSSFVTGTAGGPVLPVGFDETGQPVWSEWGDPNLAPWKTALGWASKLRANELANLFPGFMDRWLDPYWTRVVQMGIAYYLDANIPRSLQRAVALGQVGLEMLVYAVLIDGQHKTWDEIKPIGRAITRLLEQYGIPTAIPDHFKELAAEALREGWLSGPWAVTCLRNEFIHVKRNDPERPHEAWVQAWKLIVWYMEMTLMAMFGFKGEYLNRLKWPLAVWQVERVPWAP